MLAESAGENEERDGLPLVGKAGAQFNLACRVNKIDRESTLIVNTILCRPPKPASLNDKEWRGAIAHCWKAHTQPLFDRVSPRAVLTMGGPAMFRVTGFRAHTVQHGARNIPLHGIEEARGSAWRASEVAAGGPLDLVTGEPPLRLPLWGGADPWIVSTLHPAYIARGNMHIKPMFWADFGKAKRLADGMMEDLGGPRIEDMNLEASEPPPREWSRLVFDIETDASDRPDLLGIGCQGKVNVYRDVERAAVSLRERDTPKVGHNLGFDIKGLGGVRAVKGPWNDTIIAAHLVQPALPKSLAQVASLYGGDQYFYWKDMCDNPRTWAVVARRLALPRLFMQRRALYNAFDVWWTDKVWTELQKEMRYYKVTDLFRDTQMPLLACLLDIEAEGMPVDIGELRRVADRTLNDLGALEASVSAAVESRAAERLCGVQRMTKALENARDSEVAVLPRCSEHPEFTGRTKRSKCPACFMLWQQAREVKAARWNKQVQREKTRLVRLVKRPFNVSSDHDWSWLFFTSKPEGLGLRTRLKTKGGKKSLNKNALRGMLALANLNEEQRMFVMARFRIGQLESRLGKYLNEENISPDGRIHAPYQMTTTLTGRSSSGLDDTDADKPSSRIKVNAQNWPLDVRRIVSARAVGDDYVLVNADYSAIEAWMSAIRVHQVTGRREYWDFLCATDDPHRLTADKVQALTKTPCSRYQGKRCRHMWTYCASPKMVAIILAGDMVTYELAVAVDDVLRSMHPDVIEWWDTQITRARRETTLRNPLGRLCHFMVKKADTSEGVEVEDPNSLIAWWPQATAHEIAKRAWIRLREWLHHGDAELYSQATIINHAHDNFLFLVRSNGGWAREVFVPEVKRRLEEPVQWLVTPDGQPFKPTVEVSVGLNWGEYHKHGESCEREPFKPETAPGCSLEENEEGLKEIEDMRNE